jgi:hypothetical protein
MCNFHSTCWRESDGAVAHDATNSHSGSVATAGWRENQTNRRPFFFEAEWDGKGALPSARILIRNIHDCPEPLQQKIIEHYRKLKLALTTGEFLDDYFTGEKWEDVHIQAFVLGVRKTLPQTIGGWLYLSSLTSLPENLQLPQTIGGSLYLGSLTSLPENLQLPQTIGGSLYLGSLTSLPENLQLPQTIGGGLDLSSLTSLPENLQLPQTIGGWLDLGSLTSLPENLRGHISLKSLNKILEQATTKS